MRPFKYIRNYILMKSERVRFKISINYKLFIFLIRFIREKRTYIFKISLY
jgi:hypothetical protein